MTSARSWNGWRIKTTSAADDDGFWGVKIDDMERSEFDRLVIEMELERLGPGELVTGNWGGDE